jgi:membrane protease YdiL (CAAX protease family)
VTDIRRAIDRPWMRLILIALYLGVGGFAVTLLRRLTLGPDGTVGASDLRGILLWELGMAVLAVGGLFLFGMALQRRRPEEFGFPLSGVGRALRRGFALGGLLITLVALVLTLSGSYKVRVRAPGSVGGLLWILFQELLFCFLGAIFEETAVRGLIFQTLEEWLGSWTALGMSALLFGFAHAFNPGASIVSSLAIAVEAGGLLAAAFILTRNLWFPIGLHWAWNFFQGPILGVPVSGMRLPSLLEAYLEGPPAWTGGEFGLEAGLPAVIFASALGLTMLGQAAASGMLRKPSWRLRKIDSNQPTNANQKVAS